MENIGLNSDLSVGGKYFHIQTQYSESNARIVSNVFEDGQVISTNSLSVDPGESPLNIKEKAENLHKTTSADMEMLFFISDKVSTIRHAASNNKLGLVFLKKNLLNEAIREFEKALEIDPEFIDAHKNLGLALLKRDQVDEAKSTFIEAITINPEYPDLHNYLGYACFRLGEYKEAVDEIKQALEINSDYVSAKFNLSLVYLTTIFKNIQNDDFSTKIERLNQVKSLLDSILRANQNGQYKAEYLKSTLELIEENNYEEAIESLEKATVDQNKTLEIDMESEFYLNFMFGGKGKNDEYLKEYTQQLEKFIEKYPEYADLRNDLGIAYLIKCRNMFLNALEEFRNALKINPNYKKAEKNLKLAENDGKGFLILLRAILK